MICLYFENDSRGRCSQIGCEDWVGQPIYHSLARSVEVSSLTKPPLHDSSEPSGGVSPSQWIPLLASDGEATVAMKRTATNDLLALWVCALWEAYAWTFCSSPSNQGRDSEGSARKSVTSNKLCPQDNDQPSDLSIPRHLYSLSEALLLRLDEFQAVYID